MSLTTRRILLVEDEALIALDEEQLLSSAGFEVVGPMPSVASALKSIEQRLPDGAVLDITLGDTTIFPVADALAGCGIPFLIVTGHSREVLPLRFRDRPRVAKPYLPETLLEAALRAFGPARLARPAAEPAE